MITKNALLDADLWEAWIDMQYAGKKGVATLFVIGAVGVNNTILEPRFEKLPTIAGQENRLALQIVPHMLCEDGLETEILYTEELKNLAQYDGISIYYNGEVIVELDELEYIY